MTEQNTKEAMQDAKGRIGDEAKRAGETVVDEARSVAGQAASVGREQAEQQFVQGRERIGSEVGAVGSAVDQAAQQLRDQDSPLASYADELAGQIANFSTTLENTSIEDIAGKTRRLARENPALFVMGSVVAGIAASRFFKASDEPASRDVDNQGDHRGNGQASYRGVSDAGRGESEGYAEGRRAALAGSAGAYRSPVAGDVTAPRIARPIGDAARDTRVPMDSALAKATHEDAGQQHPNGGR